MVLHPSTHVLSRETEPRIVHLEPMHHGREREFLALVKASRDLHRPWVYPPDTRAAFRKYVDKLSRAPNAGYFVCTPDGALAGVVNINEMILGALCSGALGYYAFAPTHGRGSMSGALALLLRRAFTRHGLHRLEANVQPENHRSRRLVEAQGFRFEGVARRLLKIGREWKDHERWALTVEDWRGERNATR